MTRMFQGDWNPYDVLIKLDARTNHLIQKHNQLANDYEQTKRDLDLALDALQNLQKSHLALVDLVSKIVGVDALLKDIK